MDHVTHDGTINAGRKGIAYDWQAVLAQHAALSLTDDALRSLIVETASEVVAGS